jgi:hypothetical protein
MKVVSVVWDDRTLYGQLASAIAQCTNMPAVVYGLAVHPRSEILSAEILGFNSLPIEAGAPVFWPNGVDGTLIRDFARRNAAAGKLLLQVAESPAELGLLSIEVPEGIERSIRFGMTGQAGQLVSMAVDVPKGLGAIRVWAPTIPTWGGVGVVIGCYPIAMMRMPNPSTGDNAIASAPGFAYYFLEAAFTVTQGAEFLKTYDLPYGCVGVSMTLFVSGTPGTPDATTRYFDLYMASVRK